MDTLEKEFGVPLETDEMEVELPVLPVRDTVVFPRMLTPLFVGRDRSVLALEAALVEKSQLVVVTQRDADQEDPQPEDLYSIGTEVVIGRMLRMPDGSTNILAQGHQRVKIIEFTQEQPYLRVRVRRLTEDGEKNLNAQARMRAVLDLFEKCVHLNRNLPDDAYVAAMNIDEPGWLADMIASVIDLDVEQRQQILDTIDPITRLQRLSIILAQELDVLKLESEIQDQVQQEVDKGQREYFLREQMRVIQSELGEMDTQLAEINELREKLSQISLPDEARAKAEKELNRLAIMPPAAPEVGIIRTYLDWIIELPWVNATADNTDIRHVAKVLDNNHFGIPKAKERILEHIAVLQRAGLKMRSPILCFVGPPGTGKTSLGRSIAEALGRKFVRVSLGGIHDEAEIRGHRRTYIGALPGRIIQSMRRAGTINPVFMLDEIDKVGADFRGDPSAALLEALDPEQNNSFSDHYLELPYDLSKVLFITTANVLYTIPSALRDRMEVIEFSGYIEEEKLEIARQFLIPRQIEEHGLEDVSLKIADGAVQGMVREYTYEAGVRNLEREIGQICRKLTRRLAEQKPIPKTITRNALHKYLGPPRFTEQMVEKEDQVGVATGIAYTEAGGDIMPIEVTLMPGKGNLTLTGQLGEVMQESVQAAYSFVRSHAKEYDIKPAQFESCDIHVHVPEGAIPKDGPSAGITMATALISAFSNHKVRRDVAMTGEITLRGKVLPIGGLKEKILAAHRAGITTVIVPTQNQKDLVDVPKKVQRDLNIIFAAKMEDVLKTALIISKKKKSKAEAATAA
ncbi:MAG: endopeptidase La [Anaerolineae bacterium]|nr:endopeptidase La [Anaerolineales bacterium]MCQ3977339.1 endopeptidase La [Anaerolineae bacterium]